MYNPQPNRWKKDASPEHLELLAKKRASYAKGKERKPLNVTNISSEMGEAKYGEHAQGMAHLLSDPLMTRDYLTTGEAAEYFQGVTRSTILNWYHNGLLEGYRLEDRPRGRVGIKVSFIHELQMHAAELTQASVRAWPRYYYKMRHNLPVR